MAEDNSTNPASRWGGIIELQPQQLVQVALLGFAVGIFTWLIALFLGNVLMASLFCDGSAVCGTRTDVAGAVALVLLSVVGLLGLVRLGAYRPIVVIIATVASLWSLASWTNGLAWYESIAWYGIFFALFYALFSWLVRPRSVIIALLLIVPVVILVRLVSML